MIPIIEFGLDCHLLVCYLMTSTVVKTDTATVEIHEVYNSIPRNYLLLCIVLSL